MRLRTHKAGTQPGFHVILPDKWDSSLSCEVKLAVIGETCIELSGLEMLDRKCLAQKINTTRSRNRNYNLTIVCEIF